MRIILDQSCPAGLRGVLSGHEVVTAYRQGWDTLANGALLSAAEAAAFDVLVTPDRRIRYQQNFSNRRISLVVLNTNNWPVIRDQAALVVAAVSRAKPGSFEEIAVPRPPLRRKPRPPLP